LFGDYFFSYKTFNICQPPESVIIYQSGVYYYERNKDKLLAYPVEVGTSNLHKKQDMPEILFHVPSAQLTVYIAYFLYL
jgi:hypothetical protein